MRRIVPFFLLSLAFGLIPSPAAAEEMEEYETVVTASKGEERAFGRERAAGPTRHGTE